MAGSSHKTVLIGASTHPWRSAHTAVLRLHAAGHEVIAIGKEEGRINGVAVQVGEVEAEDVHTVTLYVRPAIQELYYDYILKLHPQRVIFNPGAENPAFYAKLQEHGIHAENACTLVLLATQQY